LKNKRLSPAEKAHRTRQRLYRKIRSGITILDCTLKTKEKCSEGMFLKSYMDIINHQLRAFNEPPVYCYFKHVRSPDTLRFELQYAYTYTIHISAHGFRDETTNQTCLGVGNSAFTLNHLKGVWEDRPPEDKPLLIVLSACEAGHIDLIKALAEEGCRYCIAPTFPTDWHKAALFSALFYTYLFLGERVRWCRPGDKLKPKRMMPTTAFKKAKDRLPELTGWWKMFDNGKEVQWTIT